MKVKEILKVTCNNAELSHFKTVPSLILTISFCCTYISALLSHHKRSILLQQIGTTQTHSVDNQSLVGYLHKIPTFRTEELCRKGRNIVRSSGDDGRPPKKRLSRHNRNETHMNSHRLRQHAQGLHRFKAHGVSSLGREVGISPYH